MFPSQDCQYKVLDRIYCVNFDELVIKIRSGRVLRHDLVKIGKFEGWTEAENIPELAQAFDEFDSKTKLPEGFDFQNVYTHFQVQEIDFKTLDEVETTSGKVCAVHPGKKPYYTCTICENLFCRDCLSQDAQKKWICPFCGGKCVLYMERIWRFENKKPQANYELEEVVPTQKPLNYEIVYTKLKFRDFIDAMVYPLRFPLALTIGGILFSVLVFGQIVTLFAGSALLFGAAAIGSVIVMLQFGILSKCFENLSQKKHQRHSYMPHIKKFGVFEDFVVPFITGLQSYLVAFGLFIILASSAGIFAWFSFAGDLQKTELQLWQTRQQVNSVIDPGNSDLKLVQRRQNEFRKMLDDWRLKRLESVFGTNHLADNKQLERLINSVMRLTLWFQMPICFAFFLGVLFFPAVCLSTGENHFFSLRKTFISSFKTMKIIGFDYLKIFFMCFILLMFSGLSIYSLSWLFSKLEMPAAEIFSAIVAGSFLIFYFWVAFSSILSTALLNKETTLESTPENFTKNWV